MAERRMFAKTIVDSDAFLDMPTSTQALYFHLSMRADDDGFINNPKKIQRMVGASDDDAKILLTKKFIIAFDSGVIVIKHWKIHNYIQKDRYKETLYQEEKSTLTLNEANGYTLDTECIQAGDTGKGRLGKDSLGNKSVTQKSKVFTPPSYEEVLEFAKQRNKVEIAKKFFDYFDVGKWIDAKGNKVKNWKQKFITWENRNNETSNPNQKNNQPQVRWLGSNE